MLEILIRHMISIKKANIIQKLMVKFLKTRVGTAIIAPIVSTLDRFIFKITKKKHTFASVMTGLPLIFLHCTGAKTGKNYQIPLIGIPIDDSIIIIASNWGKSNYPGWYHNIMMKPEVEVSYGNKTWQYIATETEGEDREIYWLLANEIYPGYEGYARRADRIIPVIKLSVRK